MKSPKPLQIVTAIFALSMLGIYVVQSQRHAVSAVASNPKQMPRATFAEGGAVRSRGGLSNDQGVNPSKATLVAPALPNPPAVGVMVPGPANPATTQPRSLGVVFPGSKSATPVVAVPPAWRYGVSNDMKAPAPPSPIVLPGSKSAPVFTVPGKKSN